MQVTIRDQLDRSSKCPAKMFQKSQFYLLYKSVKYCYQSRNHPLFRRNLDFELPSLTHLLRRQQDVDSPFRLQTVRTLIHPYLSPNLHHSIGPFSQPAASSYYGLCLFVRVTMTSLGELVSVHVTVQHRHRWSSQVKGILMQERQNTGAPSCCSSTNGVNRNQKPAQKSAHFRRCVDIHLASSVDIEIETPPLTWRTSEGGGNNHF